MLVGIVLLLCILFIACICLIPKAYTVTEVLQEDVELGRVKLYGFMSPVRSEGNNYFYLMESPYCMVEDNNALPVYLAVKDNFEFKHTDMYIEVTGDLIKTKDKPFKDSNGYECTVRIINARYAVKDVKGLEQYKALAETGVFEDLYMYYGLLDMLIHSQVSEDEIAEINEEEFNSMLLLFVVAEVQDDTLMSIVDKQHALIKQVNEKIRAKDYAFAEYETELTELSGMLKEYFNGYMEKIDG